MSDSPDFILFGQGNYNTLGVLHQLSEIGIAPFILSVGNCRDLPHGNILGFSKYATRLKEVNSETEGLKWIISNRDKFGKGTIIYTTSDTAEQLLDMHYDVLSGQFTFPNAGRQGAVSRLMDKQIQTDIAMNCGLRTLSGQYTKSSDFSYDRVVYPCMVKPVNSTSGSKGDMKVCQNEHELKSALAEAKETHDFIVQQYIRNEADLLFLGVALSDGTVWLPAVVVKPGVSPTGEYTHAVISTDVDKYLPEKKDVIRFVKSLNYKGPFSIEFGLENGQNYFFEINLRNDGTSHYPLTAGVNIASSYISDNISKDIQVQEYEMIDEVADLRRVINHEISFGKWIHSLKNAGSYRYYRKGDNGLRWPLIRMFSNRIFGKLFRKLSR